MSMENLHLAPEAPIDNWDDVPEQRGPSIPSLPRGEYQFGLPHNLTPDKWKEEKLQEKKDAEGKVVKAASTYYRLAFDVDFPLIVQATSVQGVEENALFRGSISTMPRPRFVGKRGDPPKQVSDAVYLYRDGLKGDGKLNGVPFKPTDDKKLVEAICAIGKGKSFIARVLWPAYCNKNKVRYILDGQGNSVEDPEGKLGCGENYRDGKTIDQATGQIAERFTCKCGAAIRVFPELSNYRAVEETQG